MTKLYITFLVTICAAVALSERPTFFFKPQDWFAKTPFNPTTPLGTGGDLLVYYDNSETAKMVVRRRNSEGTYVVVANFTEYAVPNTRTNGKWVVLNGSPICLFSVAADNILSECSLLQLVHGFILSDDTFVAYDPVQDGEVYNIKTYEYDGTNWTSIAAATLPVVTETAGDGDWLSYQVTDTHLSITDFSNNSDYRIKIYERQPDKSWSLTDDFSANVDLIGPPGTPFFNGIDTIAYAIPVQTFSDSTSGIVFLFTKSNGEWSIQNNFTVASAGYVGPSFFGYKCLFLDADTLLINAPFESYGGSYVDSGRVLMLTRGGDGVWQPVADIDGPGVFANGMEVNDHDVLISSVELATSALRFHAAPKCFHRPIDVTCNNQQVTDCNDLSSTELYTINNPECGAVDVNLLGVSLVNNQAIEMQFSFVREMPLGTAPVFCNTTITCPAPPVAPVSAPVGKVSAASVFNHAVGSLFLSAGLFFM